MLKRTQHLRQRTPMRRCGWIRAKSDKNGPGLAQRVAESLGRAIRHVRPEPSVFHSLPHLKNVAALDCVCCGRPRRSQAAHTNLLALGKAKGLKASDALTFPLCKTGFLVIGCHAMLDQGGAYSKAASGEPRAATMLAKLIRDRKSGVQRAAPQGGCMKIKRFSLNHKGVDFVVGDIHGCYSMLTAELARIGFDESRDRLFSVGDLVDRGPENDAVLDWLRRPWFHAVMGNHDDMAMRWPRGNMDLDIYRRNGGGWNIDQPREVQAEIAAAMSTLPVAIEVETPAGVVGIVHADVPCDTWDDFAKALRGAYGNAEARQAADMAMWSRGRITREDCSGVRGVRAVVVGHTPLAEPVQLGNVYHIDTGAVFGRDFTILRLDTLTPASAAAAERGRRQGGAGDGR